MRPSSSREATEPCEHVVIVILNYNGRELLKDTIQSAMTMDYPNTKVMVVDDGSTDGSAQDVRDVFPDVPVFEMGRNTKMLNLVRNTALERAQSNYVFLTDNDITFKRDCLTKLMAVAKAKSDAAVLLPRVMYRREPNRIYIDRNRFHYVCGSIDLKRDRLLEDLRPEEQEGVGRTFGCGIQLIDKRKAMGVGFFDSDCPMGWGDDGEFHHRVNLSGWVCYAVPEAVVYHEAIKGSPRVYGQIRNRLSIIMRTYAARSILVFFPALIFYELCLITFLCLKGQQGDYIRAVMNVLRERRSLLEKRRAVQSTRRVRDRDLFTSGQIYVPGPYQRSPWLRVVLGTFNGLLNLYWRLACHFI